MACFRSVSEKCIFCSHSTVAFGMDGCIGSGNVARLGSVVELKLRMLHLGSREVKGD